LKQEKSAGFRIVRGLIIGQLISVALLAGVIFILEFARSQMIFNWPWAGQVGVEELRASVLMVNLIHLSLMLTRYLVRRHDVSNIRLSRRLYLLHAYLLILNWSEIVAQFFEGDAAMTAGQILNWFGITEIVVGLMIIYFYIQIYRDLETNLRIEKILSGQFYEQMVIDALTGLPNRYLFQEHLMIAIEEARREERTVAVLVLNLDRFKVINDTFGQSVGDLLIQAVGEQLQCGLEENEMVYRLGGDEFVFILSDLLGDGDETAALACRRILDGLEEPLRVQADELFIRSCIGVSRYPFDGDDVETLLKNANTAVHRAKEMGRSSYLFYDAAMSARGLAQLQLEKDLRKAFDRDEFLLYYQPKIHITSGRIVGMEALVRWKHPERGFIAPDSFISMAEELNLITPLGEWVLRTACLQNKAWQEAGLPPLRVSVNLSAQQFRKATLVQQVQQVLRETGLEPQYLELEITESIMMLNIDIAIETIRQLKDLGIYISIDDFGTGYSSLSYLKKFPIHTLKIDQSFVRDLSLSPDNEAIVTAVIRMAHSLNLNVIAEGVETEQQLEFLRERDCHEVQGYLFSRPVPPDEFVRWLVHREAELLL